MFNILIQELRAALLFASTDESRYVLNSVCVELQPDRAPILVATDGRRMVVIESEADQPELTQGESRLILKAEVLRPLCKFANGFTHSLALEYHPRERMVFRFVGTELFFDAEKGGLVEADFPNWRQCVPNGEKTPVNQFGLNAELMADFGKAAKLLEASPLVIVNLFTQTSALEIKIAEKPNFYGVIMPCKQDQKAESQPEFLGMDKYRAVAPFDDKEDEADKNDETPVAVTSNKNTVTIHTPGSDKAPVTVTAEQFARAGKRLAKQQQPVPA